MLAVFRLLLRRSVVVSVTTSLLLMVSRFTDLFAVGAAEVASQKEKQAVAPGDAAIFVQDRAGAYFIARPLKEKYDSLQKRVASLRTVIREAKIDSSGAQSQIAELQGELKVLLRQIDAAKVYIPGAKIQTRIETVNISIGNDDLILVDCENIEIQGRDGPGIECSLEKTVLDEDGTKFDADFAGIKLVARKASGNEFFGFYKEMARRPGAREKALWDGFIFKDYIDRDLSYLTVEGLTFQQGNQNIALHVRSEKGEGSHFSQWRRQARLKLRVPKCRLVGVRGALGGFRVQDLSTSLCVLGEGNRDYSAIYAVSNLLGSFKADNFPIHHLDGIRGDVSVMAMAYIENRSNGFGPDGETSRSESPRTSTYRDIHGDLTARLCRADFSLEQIEGRIDVQNDFGNIDWTVNKKLAQKRDHRIVSQSGTISIRLDEKALGDLKMSLFTECGTLHLANGVRDFKSSMFSSSEGDVVQRAWQAQIRQNSPEGQRDPMESFQTFQRVADALYGRSRTPGVDVINRAGTITVNPVGEFKRTTD
jgi:hypothetical protein